jgi:hypothetical protein
MLSIRLRSAGMLSIRLLASHAGNLISLVLFRPRRV